MIRRGEVRINFRPHYLSPLLLVPIGDIVHRM